LTATVQPEKILRDLRELWAQLGREQETAGGVLRACSMTLLAVADAEVDAELVRRTLGILMHAHPSRAIVLRGATAGDLDARVFAECWMPFGSHQQICAEGVEISANAAQMRDVAQLLLPLIVPDLPVVLWCRGPRALVPGAFDPLFPLAEKIIFDSSAAPDAQAAIAALKELRASGRRVADLAWTRLTGWREAVAHVFDDGPCTLSSSLTSARIAFGGGPSTGVLYFSTWIERAVPTARVTLVSAAEPGLQSVTLSGGSGEISITLADAGSVEVRTGDQSACRSLLPSTTDDALMREELAILGPDPIFDAVLG